MEAQYDFGKEGTPDGLFKFAGKTAFGSKVHKCSTRNTSACWDYISNKVPYFINVSGKCRKENLCRKCWGDNPSPEYLKKFGIELTNPA